MKKLLIIILGLVLVSCSEKYNGIDISHHNKIDWDLIEKDSNIEFCYIKATEGATFKDSKCSLNVRNASKINLKVGLYHYFRTNVPVKKQFKNFDTEYRKYKLDLIPAIDLEKTNNNFSNLSKVNKDLTEFIDLFYKKYKFYPVVYLYAYDYPKFFKSIKKCPVWIGISPYSRHIPASINQIKVHRIGKDEVDLNYCSDIDMLLHTSSESHP